MTPAPGERLKRFVGDQLRFELKPGAGGGSGQGWQARLRTNIGRAEPLRQEILQAHAQGIAVAGASWRDLPMKPSGEGWSLELPLAQVGYFKAKPFLLDPKGWQHWPEGPDIGVCVHPDACRTANTLYCAFPRLFGPTRQAVSARNDSIEQQIRQIEQHGFSIIPPSGKLRDLAAQLPHILDVLDCRIVHLLPVNPTPTTYARFGRFGSPYAALDLTAVDPALVVFDRRTTGIDQFRELTWAVHLRGGRVLLDIVINHTGWGSVLQETHPEWFLRDPDGTFASPGAWGVTWEDLIELKHLNAAQWDYLADVFLTWCQRGVDGFRCDAGYMVPVPAWQYIVARVQQEFPDTVFLLEGLGGGWEATEALLTEGGLQWAYSELFQNYSGSQVASYLGHSVRQSERVGLLVHYSETHDNERLAGKGRAWSLLRNRLCALASVSGGYGLTCGVEWLATERIRVHGSTGLAWGNAENIVPELAQLNRLIAGHPCFFDGARITLCSAPNSPVTALWRESAEGRDGVLVLINHDVDHARTLLLREPADQGPLPFDLLGQVPPKVERSPVEARYTLEPGAAYCLAATATPRGLAGEEYRRARAQAAWAIQVLTEDHSVAEVGAHDWRGLAERVEVSPFDLLASLPQLNPQVLARNLLDALQEASGHTGYPAVIRWALPDRSRITLVPSGHWLLLEDASPFRAELSVDDGSLPRHLQSIPAGNSHIAAIPRRFTAAAGALRLERYADQDQHVSAEIRFLPPSPEPISPARHVARPDDLVLLTNGIGGMARLAADLGRVRSKYDCVLGANLHPTMPVDRHVFVKRIRAWVNADGFISALDSKNLAEFEPGPPAAWRFVANAGDGRTVEIEMRANMLPGGNTTVFRFCRPTVPHAFGRQLPATADVRLSIRLDLEDRNFHQETRRNAGAEHHFATHVHPLEHARPELSRPGFAFTPAADRQLRAYADAGEYHPQPEWSENIAHPVEASRGLAAGGDAYSPGWFDVPLPKGAVSTLVVTADPAEPETQAIERALRLPEDTRPMAFEQRLQRASNAFVVRRGEGATVIAGYPWFLDWGRDTLMCARGLLAAGSPSTVENILITYARLEQSGTLPNCLNGEDTSNRDTSDAPLWFALACEDLAAAHPQFYSEFASESGRTILDVLCSIATHYVRGTPNGIRMDPDSALIWSPAHFTWMDTNYPAGTPREGYPVEIQALWIRLLGQLAGIPGVPDRKHWAELADRALASVERLFWLEERGFYADVLLAKPGQAAAEAEASDALRSNTLFPVSLGLVRGARAKRCVEMAQRWLLVPGALRSLAPLPVSVPLPVYANDGRLLNNPVEPYWGRYEGDEDTHRKPAYHNGTAWTWTLAMFCEALARAWDNAPAAVAAARSYLGSIDQLLSGGCLGHVPEIVDGDAPHGQRGCDAQAWGPLETLRVWNWLRPGEAQVKTPREGTRPGVPEL